MSFVTEALIISGVALDLVGATVLSHAHNAESALELREEIGADERALGEKADKQFVLGVTKPVFDPPCKRGKGLLPARA